MPGIALARHTRSNISSITQTPLNNAMQMSQLGSSSIFKRTFGGRKRPEVKVFPVTDKKPKKPSVEMGGVSLKEVFPGTPPQGSFEATQSTTHSTTLDNGIVVSTEETYDQASTVGVFINAGSANETLATNGTTHLLQRMGFKVRNNTATLRKSYNLNALGHERSNKSANR